MNLSHSKVASTVTHQHPSAVLSQFIEELATGDDDAPVGEVAYALAVLAMRIKTHHPKIL